MSPARGRLSSGRWEEGGKGCSFFLLKWTFSALCGSLYVRISASQCCAAICSLYAHPCFWELLFLLCCVLNFPSLVVVSVPLPHLLECLFQTKLILISVSFFPFPYLYTLFTLYLCVSLSSFHPPDRPGVSLLTPFYWRFYFCENKHWHWKHSIFLGRITLGAWEQRNLPGFPSLLSSPLLSAPCSFLFVAVQYMQTWHRADLFSFCTICLSSITLKFKLEPRCIHPMFLKSDYA